jgi:hypothetical protein
VDDLIERRREAQAAGVGSAKLRNLISRLGARLIARVTRRPPDFVIGGHESPYLLRWYLTPWRRLRDIPVEQRARWQRIALLFTRYLPCIYLHQFLRSDDDSALHDHPWLFNLSVLLAGIHRRRILRTGVVKGRWGGAPHRVELHAGPAYTLFCTGPVVRNWGFHCPERGWVPWQQFTAADDPGAVGRGCGEHRA